MLMTRWVTQLPTEPPVEPRLPSPAVNVEHLWSKAWPVSVSVRSARSPNVGRELWQ